MKTRNSMAVLATTLIGLLVGAFSWAQETPPGQTEGTTQQAANQPDQPATSEPVASQATQPAASQAAQPAANQAQSTQPATGSQNPNSSRQSHAATAGQFKDHGIATQLRIGNQLHAEICRFAAQRSQNEEVKQFAQTVDRGHSEMIAKLPQPTPGVGPYDVSSTLREFAQRLESRVESRNEVLGFRGPAEPGASAQPGQAVEPGGAAQPRSDSDVEKRREELRKIIDQQQAVIRDARQENREARQENREARQENEEAGTNQEATDDNDEEDVAAREASQKLREARRELRELRDDSQRRTRDRLWARAPEILNAVAETVDEMGSKVSQGSFGDYERKVAERLATTIKKELEQKTGKAFDQAYLGYEIFCHLKTLDTMEVAKQYCSPEMCSALDESISMTQTHLQQARDLMEKISKEGT